MAIIGNLVPNPSRTITVTFPIDKVKKCLQQIYKAYLDIDQEYIKVDEILNIYRYKIDDHLTAGSWLNLTLNEVAENKTQLTIEMERIFGAYDTELEVQLANSHMNDFLKALSSLLSMKEEEFTAVENRVVEQKSDNTSLILRGILMVILIGIIIFVLSL